MASLRPGDRKENRRALRAFRHAMRGAAAWAVSPTVDLDALRSAWHGLGLEA